MTRAAPRSNGPPKADIAKRYRHVRFVPLPDSCNAATGRLFDHFVGADEQDRRDFETECPGRPQVDDQIELGGLHDG